MRHEDRPKTIRETVDAAQFPIYGLVNHAFDFSLSSHGLGISQHDRLVSVSLTFTSPRYASGPRHSMESQNFIINSVDATMQQLEREAMVFKLEDPSNGQFFDPRRGKFRRRHFSEEQQKRAGSSITWEGTLSVEDTAFTGKIIYWVPPLQLSTFLLKSKETILIGETYGPLYEEIIQLLESLQVINQQDDLIKQYQYEAVTDPLYS